MLAAALLASLAAQAAAPAKNLDAFDLAMQGKSSAALQLAQAMDKGFLACGHQISTRKHLLSSNSAELKKAGLTLSAKPPAEVAEIGAQMFKQAPIYARVDGAPASVWVVASATIPACRVTIADTADALAARKELDTLFAASKTWSHDKAQSSEKNGVLRQAYVLNKPGKNGLRMLTFIDGPTAAADGGKGIQAIITVGVAKSTDTAVKPDAPKPAPAAATGSDAPKPEKKN